MDIVATTVIRLLEVESSIEQEASEIVDAIARTRGDHPALVAFQADVIGPDRIRITLEFENIADDVDDIEDWCGEIITDAIGEPLDAHEMRRGSLALAPA